MNINPKDKKTPTPEIDIRTGVEKTVDKDGLAGIDIQALNNQIRNVILSDKKSKIFKDATYAEAAFLREQKQIDAAAATTTSEQMKMWFYNFSENLPLIRRMFLPNIGTEIECPHCDKQFENPFVDQIYPIGLDIIFAKGMNHKQTKSAIVVGGAPQLRDEHFELLKRFKGTLICTNKALHMLLNHNVVPDWVTCLDGSLSIYDSSFNFDIVRKHANKIKAFCATTVTPKVAKFMKNFKQVYWTNAWIGGADLEAYTESCIMETLSGIGQSRTGGNAGTFGVLLAHHIGCNPIGLLGIEYSHTPNASWLDDKERIRGYEIYYNPDTEDIFGISPAIKAYLHWILNYAQNALYKQDGVLLYNLSDWGMLNFTQLEFIKNMDLEVYIDHYNKDRKFVLLKNADMINKETKEVENVTIATNCHIVKEEVKNKDGTTKLGSDGKPKTRLVFQATI